MKTKKGFVLRSLGREYILVAEGLEAADANRLVSMNESAAFLWKAIEDKEFDADTLINLLEEEYGITREVAEKDVTALLQTWKEANIITD
jgi:Coenzyme PQQ synthesis protein D (PqqD).